MQNVMVCWGGGISIYSNTKGVLEFSLYLQCSEPENIPKIGIKIVDAHKDRGESNSTSSLKDTSEKRAGE
jgi:hypothetical protein